MAGLPQCSPRPDWADVDSDGVEVVERGDWKEEAVEEAYIYTDRMVLVGEESISCQVTATNRSSWIMRQVSKTTFTSPSSRVG